MENKELFKKLSNEKQMELIRTLIAYDSAHVIQVYNRL